MDNNRRLSEMWFQQANFDLKAAKQSLAAGNYEWACFQCQQAAEKALKSYLFLKGKRDVSTHSIYVLLGMCLEHSSAFGKLKETKLLDHYYLPTRYPDSLPDNIPHNFYVKGDADKCVSYAAEILSLIKKLTQS